VLVAATALSACQGGEPETAERPSPHSAPTSAGDCNDLPAVDGDPGIVLGTDWSGEDHEYGDTVTVLACGASQRGTLSLRPDGTGVTVSPRRVPLADAPGGVARFRVTVDRGATGGLRVRLTGPGSGGDLRGPEVVADDGGWHLERAD
jgi:hypothetical protein